MILILSAFSLSASALEDLTSVYGEESTSDYSEPATDIGEPDEDDENAIRTGDVDGDGKVSATDARITLRLSAKIASAGTVGVTLYADANGDGKCDDCGKDIGGGSHDNGNTSGGHRFFDSLLNWFTRLMILVRHLLGMTA